MYLSVLVGDSGLVYLRHDFGLLDGTITPVQRESNLAFG